MASPRLNLSSYPQNFKSIFLSAREEKVPIICATPKKARALRRRLYAFREAIYNSIEQNRPDCDPKLSLIAPFILITLKENTLFVSLNEEKVNKLWEDLEQDKDINIPIEEVMKVEKVEVT